MSRKSIIFYNVLVLCNLYFFIALFFAFVYVGLDYIGYGWIEDHYSSSAHQKYFADHFTRAFYFSFITLFSVGYGDLSPFGLSKGIAALEAMIGFVLPTAIFLNYILLRPKWFYPTFTSSKTINSKFSRKQ